MTRTVATNAKRVLFDARPAESCVTGIGRYAKTFKTLMRGVPGHFCWSLGEDLKWTPCSPTEEELELPYILEREEIDVFHSPLFHLPALLPCQSIITIHDAIPVVRPDLSNPGFARMFQENAKDAVDRADRVVCPSVSAKQDVVKSLSVAAEKVRVIPEIPDPVFRALGYKRKDFFLVVGSLERRKNPAVVLDALAKFPRSDRPHVTFAGPLAGFDLFTEGTARGVQESLQYVGVVSDEELVKLYNEARALIFPSLYEGFGLPILEAFACGTPVIASTAASIPEIAAGAALYFDPENAEDLASAIRALDDDRCSQLRDAGFERLKDFSATHIQGELARLYSEIDS